MGGKNRNLPKECVKRASSLSNILFLLMCLFDCARSQLGHMESSSLTRG